MGNLDQCSTLIITHLTPKRLESLKAVLAVLLHAGAPVELYLSNPAMQLLQSSFGMCSEALTFPGHLSTSALYTHRQ